MQDVNLDQSAFDPDAFERRRRKTFLWCGVVFGGALGALFGLYWFHDPRTAAAVGILGSAVLGWSSYRWGDPAWEWLGRNLWWSS